MDNSKIPVLVLFGPTASGKTGILLETFGSAAMQKKAAEVISADSMQVYRGMDIGTAKPTAEEKEILPHHLIDICDPSEQFNAGDFVRLAGEICLDIAGRGKIPVISGGTGFYLKNFIMGLSEAPPGDPEIRSVLREELEKNGALSLMKELAAVDPVSAERIHINDEYRLLRALEVWRFCGKPLSSFKAPTLGTEIEKPPSERFNFIIIGLSRPREELYSRINERCAQMFGRGLPDEVRALHKKGYTPNDPGLRAIGYREFFVEDGDNSWRLSQDMDGVQALVAQNSRRYAKRQITFFTGILARNNSHYIKWVECKKSDKQTAEVVQKELENFL
ncbi:MAG: tRNA (adenosine(37)-N6)-dimethylallyltransferase MiaA [Treponema sp.]|nr:tRNA (adenosine(37)-N6)-dimethylallyltransferase MiaA [Treponema sp.]